MFLGQVSGRLASESPNEHLHGLRADDLRSGEQVRHHWTTHGGVGILTNFRLFLLGHPHPLHRPVLWEVELETLTDLDVIQAQFPQAYHPVNRVVGWTPQGQAHMAEAVDYGDLFLVRCNQTTVFAGYPDRAARIQRWIDESRVARMMEVLGRVASPSAIRPGS